MEILVVILTAIAATTLMTLFSFILSDIRKKQFREPILLTKIIGSANILRTETQEQVTAWGIHYFIGLLFIIGYHLLFQGAYFDPTWFAAAVLGFASGAIGIIGWRLIFKFAPKAPRVNFVEYYTQLFVAHIIFAFSAIAIYKLYAAY
ncbi:MAG: hypothetical protein ITG00_01480 [Flavobacterium sp.]|nr:hypothetical protein [Flavobacterium sp.]